MNYKTNFPKKKYYCSHCGHVWMEFLPMKCPQCNYTPYFKEVMKNEDE